jgi:hypothetical protein
MTPRPLAAFESVAGQLLPTLHSRSAFPEPAANGLHVCAECGSRLVHPTDWEPTADDRRLVLLRCPECEWNGFGTFEHGAVDRLEREVDCGDAELATALSLLTRANMADLADRLARALEADAIQPMDF